MEIEQGVRVSGAEDGLASLGSDRLLGALMAAVLLSSILGAVLLAVRDPLAAVIIFTSVALIIAGLTLVTSRWASQRDALLQTLAIAVERGIPLATAIEALGESHRGRSRRRLLALTRLLQEGAPLPQALALVPGILPRDAEISIGVGWATDRLAGAIGEATDPKTAERVARAAFVPRLAYFATILLMMKLIICFVLYFIFPKFEAIFADFGLELPRFTVAVITASHWLMAWGWPILVLMTICELTLAVILPLSLMGWWKPNFFWIDRLFRSRHTAPVLRALAWGVEGGKSLSSGIAILIRYYPTGWVHNRLALTLHDLSDGIDCWESLRNRGLIGPADAAILESASRVGNLPWALREAAAGAARRSSLRLQRWIQILSTLVYLALGVLVLVVTAAFISPLFLIIERLAG
ncbi:type II secretion system F family protein [Singulisphaera acidiphila]|uniref:Type II secretory pathway, component PulF n=1 Tax=Singulisphaera acidiphila (strain ATCC BAA-1392 / DSM 18658 / VKM B-2454 / MOB10) TaxID=886293 RepID=L0DQS5_SINAD|nr:type II secretion system F family protein [Singulisphaera acidiphila]AGA31325.1 type II secretory pathway, component PulF [Singulisphaera acidiphila DSM 18658]